MKWNTTEGLLKLEAVNEYEEELLWQIVKSLDDSPPDDFDTGFYTFGTDNITFYK